MNPQKPRYYRPSRDGAMLVFATLLPDEEYGVFIAARQIGTATLASECALRLSIDAAHRETFTKAILKPAEFTLVDTSICIDMSANPAACAIFRAAGWSQKDLAASKYRAQLEQLQEASQLSGLLRAL